VSRIERRKEKRKEGFENLQHCFLSFFFVVVESFCFTVVGQNVISLRLSSLFVHFHFLPVYCAMKKVVCAKSNWTDKTYVTNQ